MKGCSVKKMMNMSGVVIALTEKSNKGPTLKLTKDDWSKLILGKNTFASLSSELKAFDQALDR